MTATAASGTEEAALASSALASAAACSASLGVVSLAAASGSTSSISSTSSSSSSTMGGSSSSISPSISTVSEVSAITATFTLGFSCCSLFSSAALGPAAFFSFSFVSAGAGTAGGVGFGFESPSACEVVVVVLDTSQGGLTALLSSDADFAAAFMAGACLGASSFLSETSSTSMASCSAFSSRAAAATAAAVLAGVAALASSSFASISAISLGVGVPVWLRSLPEKLYALALLRLVPSSKGSTHLGYSILICSSSRLGSKRVLGGACSNLPNRSPTDLR